MSMVYCWYTQTRILFVEASTARKPIEPCLRACGRPGHCQQLHVGQFAAQALLRAAIARMTHCWHVCYRLAVSARAQSASSSCERIGWHLHALEAGESNISAARVADKLRLKVAQVEAIGGHRDENLIGMLAEMLLAYMADPCIQRSAQRKRGPRLNPQAHKV